MAETLIQHLRGRHLLLLVDNCEHVIEDCAGLLDNIHRWCPDITILATSREPLRISGETVWRVPLLATPDAAASIDPHEQAPRATRAAANGLSDRPAAGVEQFARRLTARGAAGQP